MLRHSRKTWRRWLTLLLVLSSSPVAAATLIVSAEQRSVALEDFSRALQTLRPDDQVLLLSLTELQRTPISEDTRLISLDQATLAWRLKHSIAVPTIAMRVRSQAAETLTCTSSVSFLPSDPPLSRQLLLARLIQPNIKRVGLLHPLSYKLDPTLTTLAQRLNLELISKPWAKPNERRTLAQMLAQSDVLLGVDSETLYNAHSIKNILLTSYSFNQALIGPTLSFVSAGSLASTYSDQDDWLKTLDQLLNQAPASWPCTLYPEHFKVQINPQVARALSLAIPSAHALQAQIMAWEQGQ